MILDIIRGGNVFDIIVGLCVSAFVVFCIIPIHEYAHAKVAYKLGDETARLSGRLTLSPLAHINWLGALMILLVGFGYAEPVPVNIHNVRMKNKKLAMALIALAGPVSNLAVAFLSIFAMYLVALLAPEGILQSSFVFFFRYTALININLAVFNLIPVPPLDGSRILFAVLPTKYYFGVMKYERYITIAILLLLVTGALSKPLSALSGVIYGAFSSVIYGVIGLFN